MAFYKKAAFTAFISVHTIIVSDFVQILKRAALGAADVIVLCRVFLKSVRLIGNKQPFDNALLCKLVQISVNRRQANVWNVLYDF